MCGRFTLTLNAEQLTLALGLSGIPRDWAPRYNIAPSQDVLVVRDARARHAERMRWGLVPSWAQDDSIGNRLINARAETLGQKPAFRSAFGTRRCLILADGFYEWQHSEGRRGRAVPYLFRLKNRRPFAFAGLWEAWRNPAGETLLTCTIITCPANELVAQVHGRMPVILDQETCWSWLESASLAHLQTWLQPYPADQMEVIQVGQTVNNPNVDDPWCIMPNT